MLEQDDTPLVSIIIPHYLGDVLSDCLAAIYQHTSDVTFEVIVADDQPHEDGSLERAKERFPEIHIVQTGGGHGYPSKGLAAGCNRGLEVATGQYAMLLNNDVEVSDGWLANLVTAIEKDSSIGACQPKVLSLREPSRFDYGGAAGGMIDILGYTFCRGRIFESVEEDQGQYDQAVEIFWAIGGAMFLRMACLEKTGLMDEDFLMHMEEIDLCWRLQLAGYRIVFVPESVVYHYGGFSLKSDSFQKAFYNHRNQLVMLLKNWSGIRLMWVFPLRAIFELATVVLSVAKGDWKHPLAALKGLLWVVTHPFNIRRRRRSAQLARVVSDRQLVENMYRGILPVQYFLRGIRTANELLDKVRI